jgi:predicted XRE-type DNA-binding protein
MYSTHSKRKLKKRQNATSKLVGSVTRRHRKLSKRRDDIGKTNITQGSDNVFEDVGFEPKEAANLKIRADLLIDLREYIRSRGWTQAQAAAFFGETQPRISNIPRASGNTGTRANGTEGGLNSNHRVEEAAADGASHPRRLY